MILINKEGNNTFKPNKMQIKEMGKLLSQAFQDGPVYVYCIPDTEEREKKLHVLFEIFIKYALKYGKVYATSEDLEGVILSMDSTSGSMSMWRMIRCGGWKLPFKLGFKFLKRIGVIDEITEPKRDKIAPKPHSYLLNIGVLPSEQGKEHGGKLLRYYLKEVDDKGFPCYLETAKKENLSLYEHFGFQVIDESKFPGMNETIWYMLRENK